MKVYDCFAFFNELDVLELRLRELDSVVDYFVLVEATRTFQKKSKPLHYEMNKERFKDFHHKIIHIIIDEYPTFWTKFRPVTTWHYDNHQKEGILKGLKDAAPDDLIIVSDLDEIPLAEKVLEYKNKPGIRVFEQFQAYYYLNYICTHIYDYGGKAVAQRNRDGYGRWRGSVMLERKLIRSIKEARNFRDEESSRIQVIRDGGWHFSYMGGIQMVIDKINSWAHVEYNNESFKARDVVINNILEGRDPLKEGSEFKLLPMDCGVPFPQEIMKNQTRWASMIRTPEQLRAELSAVR